MTTSDKQHDSWRQWISPLRLTLLAVNAFVFGGCVVLLTLGTASGPMIGLTIATGLSFGAGLTGAIIASRKTFGSNQQQSHPR